MRTFAAAVLTAVAALLVAAGVAGAWTPEECADYFEKYGVPHQDCAPPPPTDTTPVTPPVVVPEVPPETPPETVPETPPDDTVVEGREQEKPDRGGEVRGGTPQPGPEEQVVETDDATVLPYTGSRVWLLVGAGVCLAAAGLLLRRRLFV